MSSSTTKRMPVHLTKNARTVLNKRYLKKNEKGQITETPEELFQRVAQCAADVERTQGFLSKEEIETLETAYYETMAKNEFLPNSPTLMNAGRKLGMLSACFVLPVPDSINGIFKTLHDTAMIQKAGGGTGFDFSRLRPKGDFVASSGGSTPGPLAFLELYSAGTHAIEQGSFRRGANMGMMRIDHPDILGFISIKEDLSKITNFNISVAVTNKFMETLKTAPYSSHQVRNPRTGEWSELKDENGIPVTHQQIFDLIVDRAWRTGEPGVIFIDQINADQPTPNVGPIEATNPCGEQPLLPYEACNLGSINVAAFAEKGASSQTYEFDWNHFKEVVHLCTRFLDNVVDANNYPIPEIREMCLGNRKIGLGIMGFADLLYKLQIPYNSDEGVAFGEKLMKFLNDEAHNMSETLANEKGCFPYWKGSRWELGWEDNRRAPKKQRNACSTTIAPTGTISIIAGCSGGIEPLFSLAFMRNVLGGTKMVEVNEVFKEIAKEEGFYSETLFEKIAKEGSIQHMEEIPERIRRVFVTAHDITPEWHIKMQCAFQKHCDSSISKTTNFPHQAAREDVEKIYRLAFEGGCKGVTVYRDGCRLEQPMSLNSEAKPEQRKASVQSPTAKQTDAALTQSLPH